MIRKMTMAILAGMCVGMIGCGSSTGDPTTGPATTQQRIVQDLHTVGQDIKEAATQAASEVKPALQRAKEEGQKVIHDAAQKVADSTATQPASQQ